MGTYLRISNGVLQALAGERVDVVIVFRPHAPEQQSKHCHGSIGEAAADRPDIASTSWLADLSAMGSICAGAFIAAPTL